MALQTKETKIHYSCLETRLVTFPERLGCFNVHVMHRLLTKPTSEIYERNV